MATLIEDCVEHAAQFEELSVGSISHDEVVDDSTDPNDVQTRPMQTDEQGTPRIVSLPSMSRVSASAAPSRKRASSTPYDSLKKLVKSKQQSSLKATGQATTALLHLALPGFQSLENKRRRVEHTHSDLSPVRSDLHYACADGNAVDIANLLEQDPIHATRPVHITRTKSVYNFGTFKMESREVQESYKYALNLAIRAKVNSGALGLLADAAPGVLTERDGDAAECPLSVLLKTCPEDDETAAKFILRNPLCVRVTDRNGNLPLHIACQYGVSLDTIRHLVILYPAALFLRNRFGDSPVSLAQRSIHACSEQIALYLWEKEAEAL